MTTRTDPLPESDQGVDVAYNSDAPWDDFDPTAYFSHNYNTLRDDDHFILDLVRDFFVSVGPSRPVRGIDVGSGPNLYPALAMLPWCHEITLVDHSAQNVAWLEKEVTHGYAPAWDQFWTVLTSRAPYRDIGDPRGRLASSARVQKGNLFELPASEWEMGTMFFVACSISGHHGEFEEAVDRFLRALRPGAPFAMAYMENSKGYEVNGLRFPAVEVGMPEVRRCLATRATDLQIERISSDSLRPGYTGMMVALGRVTRG